MLQASHDDATQRVFLLRLLVVRLRTANGEIKALLVLETVDIFGSMRVDVLQASGELVVEPVNEADDAAANLDDSA